MEKIWPRVLDIIKTDIKQTSFEKWFAKINNVDRKQNTVYITVSDEYAQMYMDQAFSQIIKNSLRIVANEDLDVRFVIDNGDNQLEISTPSAPTSIFNPRYTFNSFVVGNSNRFAHAAAMAVAERPSRTYNPLFIYGGSGLGKTHLMHAIGQCILEKTNRKKIVYVSTETFTNEFIALVHSGKAHAFKNRYRSTDILLIDDIQFLTGKIGTQEEFFHTFNALHEAGKQVVISSDRPPKKIEGLEERLCSRFEGGLITDIQPPDFETRCAILKRKVLHEKIVISNEVIFFIADKIQSNIRELEGALNKIVYFATLNHIDVIDMEQAAEALHGLLPDDAPPKLTIPIIQQEVANFYQISVESLKSQKRDRNIVYPRQIAMYLCRKMIGATQPQIGINFGGRDHTTVIHACDKIANALEKSNDPQLDLAINQIEKKLLGK